MWTNYVYLFRRFWMKSFSCQNNNQNLLISHSAWCCFLWVFSLKRLDCEGVVEWLENGIFQVYKYGGRHVENYFRQVNNLRSAQPNWQSMWLKGKVSDCWTHELTVSGKLCVQYFLELCVRMIVLFPPGSCVWTLQSTCVFIFITIKSSFLSRKLYEFLKSSLGAVMFWLSPEFG